MTYCILIKAKARKIERLRAKKLLVLAQEGPAEKGLQRQSRQ
jgi:hypothetical protein